MVLVDVISGIKRAMVLQASQAYGRAKAIWVLRDEHTARVT